MSVLYEGSYTSWKLSIGGMSARSFLSMNTWYRSHQPLWMAKQPPYAPIFCFTIHKGWWDRYQVFIDSNTQADMPPIDNFQLV